LSALEAAPRPAVSKSSIGLTDESSRLMIPRLNYGLVLLTNGESLLYILLQRQELIAFNLARILMGHRVNGSLSGLYLFFDVLAVYRGPPKTT
jgi:hypothetical protein